MKKLKQDSQAINHHNKTLLRVVNLNKSFPVKEGLMRKTIGHINAVENVSLEIEKNKTFGLIGESGCGKTTIAKIILRLIPAESGQIFFDGIDILKLDRKQMRLKRKDIQIVFQDPYSSLNPRMRVEDILGEPMYKHKIGTRKEISKKIDQLLDIVGISTIDKIKYPHEFSGGQCQRIAIARALATKPKLIVCDEPVSSLDVSIQSQILNLLKELKKEFGMSYLFISHEMPVVKYISDRVGVMYLGSIVEVDYSNNLFDNCLHPYTKALISAIPIPDPKAVRNKIILQGEASNIINHSTGCRFSSRCQYVFKECINSKPTLKEVKNGHFVACHFVQGKVKK